MKNTFYSYFKCFLVLFIAFLSLNVLTFCGSNKNLADKNDSKASLRIGTYNIEYDNLKRPDNTWDERKANVVALIKKYDFDLLGIQEPFVNQLNYMMSNLSDYSWTGNTIADDIKAERKHHNFIIYKKDRFEVLDSGTFWLSEDINNSKVKGWDAYSIRMCAWALFEDKRTKKEFYHFNAHFDHKGVKAREESAKLIIQKIKEIAKNKPVVVTGDFNTRENSVPYNTIINSGIVTDSYLVAGQRKNEEWKSFNGYKYLEAAPEKPYRIDHVFVTPNLINISHWELVNDSYNKKYPSDHCPIFIDCYLIK